ncbi:MAG TPA: hypothetical protein VFN55_08610, partial [Solirubrobacteraceae bacterium]|nr:hypothetical protein [Solirubrobacteraceae bacterium]
AVQSRPDRSSRRMTAAFGTATIGATGEPAYGKTSPNARATTARTPDPARRGCRPAGTRPRDLRSSFITLRVYEGIPLTQIAREAGTSVRMIKQHYASVIAN